MPTDTRHRQTTARGGNQKGKHGGNCSATVAFPKQPQIGYGCCSVLLLFLLVTNAIKTQKRRVSFPLSVTMAHTGGMGEKRSLTLDSGRVFFGAV